MKTQKSAYNEAKKLIKKMKGIRWEIKVWENSGWHYYLTNGSLQLYPVTLSNQTKYYCLLSDNRNKPFGGSVIFRTNHHKEFLDPNDAVGDKIGRAHV